jgi:hypothetical protein
MLFHSIVCTLTNNEEIKDTNKQNHSKHHPFEVHGPRFSLTVRCLLLPLVTTSFSMLGPRKFCGREVSTLTTRNIILFQCMGHGYSLAAECLLLPLETSSITSRLPFMTSRSPSKSFGLEVSTLTTRYLNISGTFFRLRNPLASRSLLLPLQQRVRMLGNPQRLHLPNVLRAPTRRKHQDWIESRCVDNLYRRLTFYSHPNIESASGGPVSLSCMNVWRTGPLSSPRVAVNLSS